jgi:hypothetical protein
VLEDDLSLSWYEIEPHELLELHACSSIDDDPRKGFRASMKLVKLLVESSPKRLPSSSASLTRLPRADLSLYIQAYWEGWVRALRVVWRGDPQRMEPLFDPYKAHHHITHHGLQDDHLRQHQPHQEREQTMLEWRER